MLIAFMKISTVRGGYGEPDQRTLTGLFADRTSTASMRSNQLRLYFSSFAYILIQSLRRLGLEGTEFAQAQCDTIRLKLFKIGAQIRVTVRKVWVSFSESYLYLHLFQRVFARLEQIPAGC
jgi:hypothetical protein